MAPNRLPSAANQELSDYVATHDGDLPARLVRTYRSERLIAKAIVTPQGYARPTLSTNPPEAFGQAVAISKVRGARRRISLTDLIFGLFDNGDVVDIVVIRRAFKCCFEDIIRDLKMLADGADDDLALAEEIARRMLKYLHSTKQGRFMASRARRGAKARRGPGEQSEAVSEQTMLLEALTVLSMVLIGGDLRDLDHSGDGQGQEADSIEHALDVTGLTGFHEDRVGEIGPIIESSESHRNDVIELWGQMFSLESLYRFSQRVEYDQLVRARDHARNLRSLSEAVARTNSMTDGPLNAFGMAMAPYVSQGSRQNAITALMVAILEEHVGREQLESSWALLEPELGRHEAAQEIIEQLPRPLRRYMGIQGAQRQERASTEILTQLRTRLGEIEAHHPELFQKVKTTGSTNN